MEQQVNSLPLVGDRGVANHLAVADVGLWNSASQSCKAEIGSYFTCWKGVQALMPQQGHLVQLPKVVCDRNILKVCLTAHTHIQNMAQPLSWHVPIGILNYCFKQLSLKSTQYELFIQFTLTTVSHIKTAREDIAGLVTELVCQPGVGTALITIRCPAKTSKTTWKLPHLSTRSSTDACHKPTVPRSTCQRTGKMLNVSESESASLYVREDSVDLFTEAVSSIPVAGRVVASFVTIPIFDPRPWAALSTVGDRPREIHLQGREEGKAKRCLIN